MRHVRVRSYFLLVLAIILALSGPFSSITFFSQNSAAKTSLDDQTLDIFAENNIMFYDPSETPRNCDPSYGAKPSGSQITWIGDSYTDGAKTIIEEKLPGIEIDSQQGRSVSQGLEILNNIGKDNLRPYLVFALGTNGTWSNETIEALKNSINPDTKVILVTAKTKAPNDYSSQNTLIKALAEDNKNIVIADWAEKGYKDEFFTTDDSPANTHPKVGDGYKTWVDVIYNAIPGGSAKSVSGGNSVEVMWSYLANTGLFTSEQIAGIIGNAAAEVGGVTLDYPDVTEKTLDLNPLLLGTGWAKNQAYLFQWTKTANNNKTKLDALMSPQYGQYLNDKYYYEATPSSIPIEDRKGIIEIQLKYAIEVGGGASVPSTWIKEVQAQTTVAAAAEAFLVSFEGATGSEGDGVSQAIQEYQPISSTYKKFIKQYPYQTRDVRVGAAQQIYEMYKGYSGSSMDCNPVNADAGDALAFLQQYVRDINYLYDANAPMPTASSYFDLNNPNTYTAPIPPGGTINKTHLENSSLSQDDKNHLLSIGGCFGGATCRECTALSGWFVTMFTSYTYGSGHGREVTSRMKSANNNDDALTVQTKPRAWSVFSEPGGSNGHTGIVLEYDENNNEIITIENNLGFDSKNPENSKRILAIRKRQPVSGTTYVYLENGLDFSHLGTTYGQ